jgi:hypothetical protein
MVNSITSPNKVRAIPFCLYYTSLFVTQNSIPFYTGWFMKYGYHCRCNQKSSWKHGSYSQWVWCYGGFVIFVNTFLWTDCTSDKVYYKSHDFKQAFFLTLYVTWCKQISGPSLETPMPQVQEVSYYCNKQCGLFTTVDRGALLLFETPL